MRVLTLYTNFYGQRFAEHLSKRSPDTWKNLSYLFTRRLPAVIDDPEEQLPEDLPAADLLVYVGQDRRLAELVPDLAKRCGVAEVIAAVDARAYFPTGLANQVKLRLKRSGVPAVFPAPFCSLEESMCEGALTREFAGRFGRAHVNVTVLNGRIKEVEVVRGSACGSTLYVAERLPGNTVAECVEHAGLYFHAHPCMASMEMDREIGDTILHVAGHLVKNAVQAALDKTR
jgi:hypothetical protein